ncbi:MAG: hypothetical protein JXR84_14160 [Anaerolineae bacterium]|nr:hypothetical protein [Anaerolineae bacterium]
MHNDYEALKLHKIREQELLREAREYHLAAIAREPKVSLGERFRAFLASINAKLYLGPAKEPLDCILLPSAC